MIFICLVKTLEVFIGCCPHWRMSSSALASDQDPNPECDLPLGGGLSPFKNHPVTRAFCTVPHDQRGGLSPLRVGGVASKTEVGKHLVEQK